VQGKIIDSARARLNTLIHQRDLDILELRIARWIDDVFEGLSYVYGDSLHLSALLERVVETICRHVATRPEALRLLDLERELRPDWFQSPKMIGYVCYTDHFGGTLGGPVYIPGKFNRDKNKMFFFYSHEEWRTRVPQSLLRFTMYFTPFALLALVVICSLAGVVGALLFADDGPVEAPEPAAGSSPKGR